MALIVQGQQGCTKSKKDGSFKSPSKWSATPPRQPRAVFQDVRNTVFVTPTPLLRFPQLGTDNETPSKGFDFLVPHTPTSSQKTTPKPDAATPRKPVSGQCILCGKSPSGKLRNLCPNRFSPSSNPLITTLVETFNVDIDITEDIVTSKLCVGCKSKVEAAGQLRKTVLDKLVSMDEETSLDDSLGCVPLTSTPRSSDDRSKRMAKEGETPTSSKRVATASKGKSKCVLSFMSADGQDDSVSDHNYHRSMPPRDDAAMGRNRSYEHMKVLVDPPGMPVEEMTMLQEVLNDDKCTSLTLAQLIMTRCPTLKEAIESVILQEVGTTATHLCSKTLEPGPSVLRTMASGISLLQEDVLSHAVLELRNALPFVHDLFMSLANPPDFPKTNSHHAVATMYGIAMHSRNFHLCAIQKINTAVAVRLHASNELLQVFHKVGITLAEGSKLAFLDQLGEMNTEGLVMSLRKELPGKLTMDNIDGMIMAKHVRLGDGNKHYHHTAATYYVDRFPVSHLSMVPPNLPQVIGTEPFLMTTEEIGMLRKNLCYQVGRILVNHCPELKWMERCIPKHIPHPYSDAMAKKSEFFSLKIILQDPKYHSGCIGAMDELIVLLQDCFEKAGEDFDKEHIILGGDQLVRVRASSARDLRAGAHTRDERLEPLSPEIVEFFHVQQDFLEKMIKKLYDTKAGREIGSLTNYRVMLSRTNVNGQVKGRYQSHDDFVQTVGTGLMLSLAMEKLGMKDMQSKPTRTEIPDNINRMHVKNREPLFFALVGEIVKEIFFPFHLDAEKPVAFEIHVPGHGNMQIKINSHLLQGDHSIAIKVPGVAHTVKVQTHPQTRDELRNYNLQVLQWFVILQEFADAIKEGDPIRSNLCLKHMLPFFYGYSRRSKYFIELVDYILKTEVTLPPALALRCQLASFVNPHGGHNNKPADMQQENNILVLKDVIKGLGASKTEKAIIRATKAAPIVDQIVQSYKTSLGITSRDGSHKRKSDIEDVNVIVNFAMEHSVFKPQPGRKMGNFSGIKPNSYAGIDKLLFSKHLTSVANRLKRGATIEDLYDDDE